MWLILVVLLPAHAKPPGLLKALTGQYDPAAGARASIDAFRGQLAALPPVDGAVVFATAVGQVFPMFPEAERAALLAEAMGNLDRAAAVSPGRSDEIETARGLLLVASGDKDKGAAVLRQALAAKPSLTALSGLLAVAPTEAPVLCASLRSQIAETVGLIDLCAAHGDPLTWASPQEIAAWRAEQERRAVAASAREAESAARLSEMFPQNASVSSTSPAPTAGGSVSSVSSVTLHSNCSRTVRVFFGDTPKYGSGTTSSVSSNSTSSYSLRPGSMIWIVDASDNGLSSTSVGSGSQRIEISSSCGGFGTN